MSDEETDASRTFLRCGDEFAIAVTASPRAMEFGKRLLSRFLVIEIRACRKR